MKAPVNRWAGDRWLHRRLMAMTFIAAVLVEIAAAGAHSRGGMWGAVGVQAAVCVAWFIRGHHPQTPPR